MWNYVGDGARGFLEYEDCNNGRREAAAKNALTECQTPALQAKFVEFAGQVKRRGLDCRHLSANSLSADDYEVVYQFFPKVKDTVRFTRRANSYRPSTNVLGVPFFETMDMLNRIDLADAMNKK